jgi:ABC-type lipoprotein release transport system permease subunit
MGSGHIAFQDPAFRHSRSIDDRMTTEERQSIDDAIGHPEVSEHVESVVPRLESEALANSAHGAVPVMLVGVDPTVERGFSTLDDKVQQGRYLEEQDSLHAFLGVDLAERLNLEIGSRLVLTAQDASGEIAGQFVRVVGTFETGLPRVDEGLAQIPLATAQEWLDVGDDVTTIAVLLDSSWEVDDVVERVRDFLGEAEGVAVLSWRESMPELHAAIKVDDYGDYVFHVVLFAIIALAIVNTVFMSVLQRTREFGVIRALGLTRDQTAAVVIAEGLILTLVSGLVGLVIGYAFTWAFFHDGLDYSFLMQNDFTFSGVVLDPVIVPHFRWLQVAQSLGVILIIGTLASLYPAYRATRIDVTEAMKFEG